MNSATSGIVTFTPSSAAIPVNQNGGAAVNVGTPIAGGTYTITASGPVGD